MSREADVEESELAALQARWHALVPDQPALGVDLIKRYAEPTRHYHDVEHLAEVLSRIDQIDDEADDPFVVRLAAWFHDAVYDVRAPDNEERSAHLAETELAAIDLGAAAVAEVARLVRLTTTHAPSDGDRNGIVLCDADLAILASPAERYERYVGAVRREYAHVPDPAFRAGRADILHRLLDLPQLFGTRYGATHWESPARLNLERELSDLAS